MKTPTEQISPQTEAFLLWFRVVILIGVIGWLGYTVYYNGTHENAARPFKFGLDLAGGSHLVYQADTSAANPAEVPALMNVLRDVVERRVNVFGVSEPIVQVERSSFAADVPVNRLVVELPGITDVSEAVAEIGRTPLLEFKLLDRTIAAEQQAFAQIESVSTQVSDELGDDVIDVSLVDSLVPETPRSPFVDTGLTGRYLERATLEFAGQQSGRPVNEPVISVRFNSEGAQLFADITRNNVGEQLGIFLDGELLSAPNINEPIVGGTAIISGSFQLEEARQLVQNLNFGALPLPITLETTQTVGASLGDEVLEKGVMAGVFGLVLVLIFMILWYRLPGLMAGLALLSYVVIMLAVFQFIPVTLTAAGLAGFVLSIGMAVDANVLVFERMKEEWRGGASSRVAAQLGFARAWSAIRDGNVTSILSAVILFWFGTSMVKGFALVFGIGVIFSMLSALLITRTLLLALPDVPSQQPSVWRTFFGSGFTK